MSDARRLDGAWRGAEGGDPDPGHAPRAARVAGVGRRPYQDGLRAAAAALWSLGIALCASVAASQILLGAAGLVGLVALARGRLAPRLPPGSLALGLFASWTVLSALASAAPAGALWKSKEILLLAVPALGATLLVGARRAERALALALGCGAILAAWGIVEYARGLENPFVRMRGPLSQHLTFAGIVMLLFVAAAACSRAPGTLLRRTALGSLPLLALALLLNQSRSAWLGAAAGLGVLAVVGPRRTAAALLLAGALGVAVHPQARQRALSLFAPESDTSIEARRAMRRTGARMAGESPWLGAGPGGVPAAYARLQDDRYPLPLVQHLHSNSLQIIAERGWPAWIFWSAAWVLLALGLRRPPEGSVAAAGPHLSAVALAALASFLVMGAFEYNFGDAEPSTLLLGLVGLPFARRDGGDSA